MYISLLDFLEEVKKKYLIIIVTFILFLSISIYYTFSKKNYYSVTFKTNLLKLSSLSLEGFNFEKIPDIAVKWIADASIARFDLDNKEGGVNFDCDNENFFLGCKATGRIDGEVENVKENVLNSIDSAFADYELHFVTLMDELILSQQELYSYVVDDGETAIETKADYLQLIKKAEFVKGTFILAINESKPKIDQILVKKIANNLNLPLVLLSSLICSLFLIFLQMKTQKN